MITTIHSLCLLCHIPFRATQLGLCGSDSGGTQSFSSTPPPPDCPDGRLESRTAVRWALASAHLEPRPPGPKCVRRWAAADGAGNVLDNALLPGWSVGDSS